MTPPLEIHSLCVDLGGVPVVQDLSCTIDRPGWIGIVGANGSGKTTLLRALGGRLPIRAGRIVIGGTDCSVDRAARADRIGFAVESRALPPELTPRQIFAIAAKRRDAFDDPALEPLREALNLEPFLDRRCGTLSAGMGQRVAILAAFLDLPGIVILDEPFNWLDPLTAHDVKGALRRMVADRQLILITALHDVATLTAQCDRGLLLAGGRLALRLEEAELRGSLADPAAFEAYIVDQLRTRRDPG